VQRTKIKELLKSNQLAKQVCVKGWVRTKRVSKDVMFIVFNDGSTLENLQIVVDPGKITDVTLQQIATGASLSIQGTVVASQGTTQAIELQAEEITLLGPAPDYPLQPKKHSLEFLRDIAHLRFRTNTLSAVFRVRHAISYAIHQFFYEQGFTYIHTPIITGIDAEGAGAMFNVTTLDMEHTPKTQTGQVDFRQDFFGQRTNLTVSGQLEAEAAMMGLGEVYTFGPTFRAEQSNTTRHLAEFWMVEPEMAFYDLTDNISLATHFLQYVIRFALDHCQEDLAFLQKRELENKTTKPTDHLALPLIERLELLLANPFAQVTYTEAINILKESQPNQKKKFVYPIDAWGVDLQSEHERYLVEQHFQRPVILTDYPSSIKAFYMRQNEDGKTVAAMDILFPGMGEIIGGSQREERLDRLQAAMQRMGIAEHSLEWYLDTRRFGTVPHSGFGLGLERLVQFITGMENIRDVIPFPRTPGHAAF
jgi:asparaginyl-tRNA synthetase